MIGHLLNKTAEVYRRAEAGDDAGGRESTWVKVGTRRVRVSQPTAQERFAGAQQFGDLTHYVYDLHGADIRRGDQIRVEGLVLRVMTTLKPSEPAYLRADCEQLQQEEGVSG